MPPKAPVAHCLRSFTLSSPKVCRTFSTTPSVAASTVTHRRRQRDPYAIAQAKARKAANISRQEVLKKERAAALGDPVRGITTPFVQSFDTGRAPRAAGNDASDSSDLNFFLSPELVEKSIKRSRLLTTPLGLDAIPEGRDASGQDSSLHNNDPTIDGSLNTRLQRLKREQDTAEEAIRRITSLSLGNAKDRLLLNKRRCIETFGRHETDKTLAPRPRSALAKPVSSAAKRVGPDTGSSEVQIAILTAKIRALANFLETRGTGDKVNKRNLRLLVHRRQKLLQYLERKERGGPRWKNVIETLGLTEGTWKGEISL